MSEVNNEWLSVLRKLLSPDRLTVAQDSTGAAWKGRTSSELLAYQTTVPMDAPLITVTARGLSHKFAAAEAAWIASGDNRVSSIVKYSSKLRTFSDDGTRFFGAYGPKFVDQCSYVVSTLVADQASRQAVINIWREQPRQSKDVPCTLSLQYLIRAGKLECVATMRSSDLWTGWPYDVHTFSTLAACVALELRLQGLTSLKLGHLTLTAGSQHLYLLDHKQGFEVLKSPAFAVLDYAPLNLDEFANPDELINHLWALARGDGTARHAWLRELFQ